MNNQFISTKTFRQHLTWHNKCFHYQSDLTLEVIPVHDLCKWIKSSLKPLFQLQIHLYIVLLSDHFWWAVIQLCWRSQCVRWALHVSIASSLDLSILKCFSLQRILNTECQKSLSFINSFTINSFIVLIYIIILQFNLNFLWTG